MIAVFFIAKRLGFFAHKNKSVGRVHAAAWDDWFLKEYRLHYRCFVQSRSQALCCCRWSPKHLHWFGWLWRQCGYKLPRYWKDAVKIWQRFFRSARHGTLDNQHGFQNLRDAMFIRDPAKILRFSAELGHYVADARAPAHNIQLWWPKTGQNGIHSFWESRVPELYFNDYDFPSLGRPNTSTIFRSKLGR